jgi:hypothetical protein
MLRTLALLAALSASADEWPLHFTEATVQVIKADGLEPEDPHWMHLHVGHHSATHTESVQLRVQMFRGSRSAADVISPEQSGVEIRYTVHGVPVSEWISPATPFTLRVDNPALNALSDGFHDISVDVRGANRANFKPHRAFLHMTRGREVSYLVPVINSVTGYNGDGGDFGPAVVYVDSRQRRMVGHPADPSVTPWTTPPHETDLYLEQLAPNGDYVAGAQMWWEDPPHPGVPFARALDPNQSQDHRGLRVADHHYRGMARKTRPRSDLELEAARDRAQRDGETRNLEQRPRRVLHAARSRHRSEKREHLVRRRL